MAKKYYLHVRDGIYYVQFANELTGKPMVARSTFATDKTEAEKICDEWLKTGLPEKYGRKSNEIKFDTIKNLIKDTYLDEGNATEIVKILAQKKLINHITQNENIEEFQEWIEFKKVRKAMGDRARIRSRSKTINPKMYEATIRDCENMRLICERLFKALAHMLPKVAYYDEVFSSIGRNIIDEEK